MWIFRPWKFFSYNVKCFVPKNVSSLKFFKFSYNVKHFIPENFSSLKSFCPWKCFDSKTFSSLKIFKFSHNVKCFVPENFSSLKIVHCKYNHCICNVNFSGTKNAILINKQIGLLDIPATSIYCASERLYRVGIKAKVRSGVGRHSWSSSISYRQLLFLFNSHRPSLWTEITNCGVMPQTKTNDHSEEKFIL